MKQKKGIWSDLKNIIITLLIILAILAVMKYTGIWDKLAKTISPDCAGVCKNSCNYDTEYEYATARCKVGSQVCCIPYNDKSNANTDNTGVGNTTQNPATGSADEGKTCTTQQSSQNMVVAFNGECVSKCEYCANPLNQKKRAEICKTPSSDFVFTANFKCDCNQQQEVYLARYNKAITQFCPGAVTDNNAFCCDKNYDTTKPTVTVTIWPAPDANTYADTYKLQVECKKTVGIGGGCDTNLRYIIVDKTVPLTTVDSCSKSIIFQNASNATLVSGSAEFTLTNTTITNELWIGANKYTKGAGYRGNVYVMFCAEDKIGNAGTATTAGLPILLEGNTSNCLRGNGILSTANTCRDHLPVPCYGTGWGKITDPLTTGLLCKGTDEYYFSDMNACLAYQPEIIGCGKR